jgi:hypothetical protein
LRRLASCQAATLQVLKIHDMKHIFIAALAFCLSGITAKAQNNVTISAKDFEPLVGAWDGTLSYLDYTSNKPVNMPAQVDVAMLPGKTGGIILKNSFSKERNVRWADTLTISANGRMLGSEKVISKERLINGMLRIVTEEKGVDGNDRKPALFRFTYTIGANYFSKSKAVLFNKAAEWLQRNEYSYATKLVQAPAGQ